MSIISLVEESINNPPVDGDQPRTEEGKLPSLLTQARTSAFVNLADTAENVETDSPGAKFSLEAIRQSNSAVLQGRLANEAIETRKAEVQEIEEQILNSTMSPEAAFNTIKEVRASVYAGVAPEDLAVDELSVRNVLDSEFANNQDVMMQQAIENKDKYSTQAMLAQLRSQVDAEFDATIPGVEDAYEFIATHIFGFLRSKGTSVAGFMDDIMGLKTGFFEKLAPGNQIIEAQKMFGKMTQEERAAVIKKAYGSIKSRGGIIFDNEEDAMILMNTLEAIAGTRVQAEASRVSGTTGQFIDTLLTLATGGTLKAAKSGAQAVGRVARGRAGDTAEVASGAGRVDRVGSTAGGSRDMVVRESVREVEGEVVERAARAEAPRLGVDPLDGEYVRVGDAARLTGPKTPKGKVPESDIKPGGTPNRYPHTGTPAFSPAQILNDVAPRTAGPILSDAVTDTTGGIARGLGATRAQVADDTIAPIVGGGKIRRGASLIAPSLNNSVSDTGANIINLMHDAKLYTKAEIDEVEKGIGSVLDNLASDEITLVNKSEAFVDERAGRISMNYTIGAGGGHTFATAQEARGFIARLPSSRLDNFDVLKFDPKQNAYVSFTGDATERGDFLLRARYTHVRSSGAKAEDVLKADTAHFLTNHVDTSVSLIDRVSKGISRLDIRMGQASKMFREILKPMEDLTSKADLDDVWDALKQAEKRPDDFTHGQLTRKLGGDQRKIAAYRSVRNFYQAVYEIRNLQYRDYLSKRGFLTHAHPDGVNNWVKPVPDSQDVVTVWWDEAGGIVSKQSLIDQGIELDILKGFKNRRVTDEAGEIMETPFVAVRKGKTDLQPLPSQVLYNKRTYLGRHMDAKYVIEELENVMVNGTIQQVGRVIAVANNPVDASREAVKGANRRSRRAIETTESSADFLTQELNQMHDLQMLTNTKHRLDFEQMDVTRQHSILSPEESLDRVRNTMAKSAVLNEWVEYNTNKWIKTYGHLFDSKGFPWGGAIQLKPELATNPEAIRQIKRARKVRERIQITTGRHDLMIGEKYQQAMLGAGEWLSRAGANVIKRQDASLVRSMKVTSLNTAAHLFGIAASVNPVARAKALAHLSFIVANPIRQLVMQSTSAMMYSGVQHGSKYFASGQAMADFAYLVTAKSWKDVDGQTLDSIVTKYAKARGISNKEARKFFDDFEASGTLESVSGHQFLEHGFRAGGSYRNHAGTYGADEAPGLAAQGWHSLRGGVKTGMRTMSHVGFEAGEKANRISAYLATRNKHMVNGTLDSLDATDLGTEALRISGNMGQFSKAGFQVGALGLPFQFMSYSTRMLQYMMPHTKWTSWVASDTLSNAEKGKVALWQAMMFGTGGLGVGAMFLDGAKSAGIEPDPYVQNALEEGLAGLGMEALIQGMAGSDANLDMSETMGPLSGITGDFKVVFGKGDRAATPLGQAYKVIGDLVTGLPVGFEDLTGASSGAVGNYGGIALNANKIWMNPVLGVGEKLELQARHLAVLLPVVNNALQARMMAATGEYTSKYGTPVAQTTIAEALSRGLIGVGPAQVDDVYKLNAEMRGTKVSLLPPSHKELSSSGKDMANFTYNALMQLNNGQMTKQEVLDRIEAGNAGVHMAYEDQTDRDIVRQAMRKELIKLTGSRETLAEELVKVMASDLELSQEIGWDKVLTNVEKTGPSEYKDYVIENIRRIKSNESGSKLLFEPEF